MIINPNTHSPGPLPSFGDLARALAGGVEVDLVTVAAVCAATGRTPAELAAACRDLEAARKLNNVEPLQMDVTHERHS